MAIRISRRTFITASVAALAAPALARMARAADEPLLLRCSLDTAPSHLRKPRKPPPHERTPAHPSPPPEHPPREHAPRDEPLNP